MAPDVTRVLLSFSRAYAALARRIAADLRAVAIDVRFDQWEGGGGVPGTPSVTPDLDEVLCVLPLLTPSDAAPTWVGDEWQRTIYDQALARGISVLPLRGDGSLEAIPAFLRDRSFADLRDREYAPELRRLIETIRERSGDARIAIPDDVRAMDSPAAAVPDGGGPLTLEAGEALSRVLESGQGTECSDAFWPMVYDGLFYELGVRFPPLRVQSSPGLVAWSFRIAINGVPELLLEIPADAVLVNERASVLMDRGFAAEAAINPATGAEHAWIPDRQAPAALDAGLTTWDAQGFVGLALSSLLRRKAADFVGIDETRAMLAQIEPVFPQLVAETVPKTVSLFVLTDVLRRLVAEEVSIRNLRAILMALADLGRVEHDPLMLTEYARAALKRQLTHRFSRGTNQLVVLLLDPDIEQSIRDATRHTATGSYVDLEPDRLRAILDAIREPIARLPDDVQMPQLLTGMEIRSSVRRLVAPSIPHLHVVSYQELRPDADVQPIGRVSLNGFTPRPGVSVNGVPVWPAGVQDRRTGDLPPVKEAKTSAVSSPRPPI